MTDEIKIGNRSRSLQITAVVGAGLVAAASFALSFPGIVELFRYGGTPQWLAVVSPVAFDAAILVFAIVTAYQASNGSKARLARAGLGFFTLVTVLIQAAHVYVTRGYRLDVETGLFMPLFSLPPIALFLSTHVVVDALVVAPAKRVRRVPVKPVAAIEKPAAAKSTINEELAQEIRELLATNVSERAISEKFGISRYQVAKYRA